MVVERGAGSRVLAPDAMITRLYRLLKGFYEPGAFPRGKLSDVVFTHR